MVDADRIRHVADRVDALGKRFDSLAASRRDASSVGDYGIRRGPNFWEVYRLSTNRTVEVASGGTGKGSYEQIMSGHTPALYKEAEAIREKWVAYDKKHEKSGTFK